MINLTRAVNDVWLMEPNAARSVLSVFDAKLNGDPIAMMGLLNEAERASAPTKTSAVGKTLLINIEGTLVPRTGSMQPYCGMFPTNALTENLTNWVKGYDRVIFHINSGGGVGIGVAEAAEVIANLEVETIAFVDYICGSGAYWLASACEKIYAHPSAIVGSIGAYVAVTKQTEKGAEEALYKTHYFSKGKNKIMFNPSTPLTDEESAKAELMVTNSYESFVGAVCTYRKLDRSVIDEMNSEVFAASEVVGTLVDNLATLEEVVNGTI